MRPLALLLTLSVLSTPPAFSASSPIDPAQSAFFEKKIRPVLVDKCFKCHASDSDKIRGGLLLDSPDALRRGGDSGPAIIPGDPASSLLITALLHTDKDTAMPPIKSGGKLPDSVIADFTAWVKMGAPDPRPSTPTPLASTQKPLDWSKERQFWSFIPPQNPPLPTLKNPAWPRSPIDHFILANLEAHHLQPAPDSDRRNLIRRLSFDLIGLPPSQAELDAFFRDSSPNAVATLVDRLLASPQFGERWGRHWLDLARYAESTGKERNFTFPHAWRYRDYVIASFNADKPYDQFIREQLAGDLLPATSPTHRNELTVATGFLTLGPKGLNEKNRLQFEMDLVDDQIDLTSRAFLGLTAACARCHNHKFDPIPTSDYYALAGIFRSSKTFFGTLISDPAAKQKYRNGTPLIPLSTSSPSIASPSTPLDPLADFITKNPQLAARIATLSPTEKLALVSRLTAKGRLPSPPPIAKNPQPKPSSTPDLAMGVKDWRPINSPIFIRGEIDSPSTIAPRGFLTILSPTTPTPIPPKQSGRLELASWIASPHNPLTARVAVNRIWLQLFGQGIVSTPDNFGSTGEKPSNPPLLDFLATQFTQNHWSTKSLIRSIVLSRTYQLSTTSIPENFLANPDNSLFWRMSPRRLDAEAIRDGILAASGQLQLTPPHASLVALVGDGYINRGIDPAQFNLEARYRSVYLPIVRDYIPDALSTFDFAETTLVVASRDSTNVPAQALFMMNSPFVIDQSKALAKRLLALSQYDESQRIIVAYLLTLARPPSPTESARAQDFLHAHLIPPPESAAPSPTPPPPSTESIWANFCQALFASAEFRYLK